VSVIGEPVGTTLPVVGSGRSGVHDADDWRDVVRVEPGCTRQGYNFFVGPVPGAVAVVGVDAGSGRSTEVIAVVQYIDSRRRE
jgi:hypothetical protein